MYEYPSVKGWKPFVSVVKDIEKKEKKEKKEKNDCEMLDVPKDWKTPTFKLEDYPHKQFALVSKFTALFATKLAPYLKEVFPVAQKALEEHKIKARLILNDGEMTVETTRNTYDPVMILRANSLINLLARYVPVEEAIRVLEDDVSEDTIAIACRKPDTFHRRRSRLLDSSIQETIKEVLDCNIYVIGKTVSVIGSEYNVRRVRKVVDDCFIKNIHPIYTLKQMMMQNKFKSMPEMADKDWSSLMPKIPKKNIKTKKPKNIREKKEYDPFPPAMTERKVDKELEAGVFHLKHEKKAGKSYYQLIDKVKTKEEEKNKKKEERKAAEKVNNKPSNDVEVNESKKRKSDDHDQPKPKKLKKENKVA